MRRHALLLLVVGLAACEDDGSRDTGPDGVVDGCPDGMHRASSAGLTVTQFVVDGLDVFTAFDPTATYGTLPSACIGDDGRSLQLVVTAAGEPYGALLVESAIAETYTAQDPLVTFAVTLFSGEDLGDADDTTFSGNDWQTGLVDVRSVGSLFEVTANGAGFSEDHSLTLQFSAEGTL